MKYLRESSEDEMILEFLKGEIKSSRFQDQIHKVLNQLELKPDLIDNANLKNDAENRKRKEIMSYFRGYGRNTNLFENYPNIKRWIYAECSTDDIQNIRYINYSYWNELSKHTSSPLIAAETIREGTEIYGVSNSNSIEGVELLKQGIRFSPIILLTADNQNYILLEGHSRMTIYGLAPQYFNGTYSYIGICDEIELKIWNG